MVAIADDDDDRRRRRMGLHSDACSPLAVSAGPLAAGGVRSRGMALAIAPKVGWGIARLRASATRCPRRRRASATREV